MKGDVLSMSRHRKNCQSESAVCPRCGQAGRAVSEETVGSLVTDQAAAKLGRMSGFWFCPAANCGVVYFRAGSGEWVSQEEVRVAVFQKSADPKRLVCYCFGHSVEAVQSKVRAGGGSRILEDIKSRCARGLDDCEHTNPQGSCCLGNVQRVFREVSGGKGAEGSCGCCHGDVE